MRPFIAVLVVLCVALLCGCSGTKVYQNSPYGLYSDGMYSPDAPEAKTLIPLIHNANKTPRAYWVHWQIAYWAYLHKHYGTALFALNELNKYYPELDYQYYYRNFNLAIILYRLGMVQAARGRFEYVQECSNNFLLNNRCTIFLMAIDNGEVVKEDYYAYDY
ncbi:hypothetical protein [Maridesulfovibrio bastinii]|uniref:hypothetical protein n=1 Tax=Maridesulfovibrio bastinii TaxID=47157 RepID=UPI000484C239|nr:hypothetical protein [Maridesulfovibrio bastinii]